MRSWRNIMYGTLIFKHVVKLRIILILGAFLLWLFATAAWTASNETGEPRIPDVPPKAYLGEIEKAVDSYRDRASQRKLELILPGRDSHQIKLRRLLILSEHAHAIPGGELLRERYLADLREDPKSAFDSIMRTLSDIPVDLGRERALLLQFAANLPGNQEVVRKLAFDGMSSRVVEAKAFDNQSSAIPPLDMHAAFLTACTGDAAAAFEGTVKAIVAQTNVNVRRLLAAQFVSQFPADKEKLNSVLLQNGVEIEPKPNVEIAEPPLRPAPARSD